MNILQKTLMGGPRLLDAGVYWLVVCGLSVSVFSACNQCSKSNIERKGEAVSFEKIGFGINETTFLNRTLSLIPLNQAPEQKEVCRDQISLLYPDLREKTMVERPAGDVPITSCTVRALHVEQTPTLIEIKGEFLKSKLSRITFKFAKPQYQAIESTLKQRFGDGDTLQLIEQVIIDATPKTYRYWTDDKEIWLLSEPEIEPVTLIRQELKSGAVLREPLKASKRGVPVSLEDIGIGKLDLDAPLPDLTGIDLSDGGVISEAPPPRKENTASRP